VNVSRTGGSPITPTAATSATGSCRRSCSGSAAFACSRPRPHPVHDAHAGRGRTRSVRLGARLPRARRGGVARDPRDARRPRPLDMTQLALAQHAAAPARGLGDLGHEGPRTTVCRASACSTAGGVRVTSRRHRVGDRRPRSRAPWARRWRLTRQICTALNASCFNSQRMVPQYLLHAYAPDVAPASSSP
jgi:hypothetical protein